jgi:hypothetical protein
MVVLPGAKGFQFLQNIQIQPPEGFPEGRFGTGDLHFLGGRGSLHREQPTREYVFFRVIILTWL